MTIREAIICRSTQRPGALPALAGSFGIGLSHIDLDDLLVYPVNHRPFLTRALLCQCLSPRCLNEMDHPELCACARLALGSDAGLRLNASM